MLWKYKKCYQETNEDIPNPPPKTCQSLLTVTGTYTNDGNRVATIQYNKCKGESLVKTTLTGISDVPVTVAIEECIIKDSLFVNGVNITNETPTVVPSFIIQADFDSCDNPCYGIIETASIINNIYYQEFPAGYIIDCTLNSYCYLQYSEDGTTWITHPTLYAPTTTNFLVSLYNDKIKFRFISKCQNITSNEYWITTKYCFGAIYECDDPIHVPPGGVITYINSAGQEVTESGFCGEDFIIINAVEIINSNIGVHPNLNCSRKTHLSFPGRSSSSLACNEIIFPVVVYSDVYPIDLGSSIFNDISLSIPFNGDNLWYQDGIQGVAFKIDNGIIIAHQSC